MSGHYFMDSRYMNMHWAQHDMATRESADWLLHNMPASALSFAGRYNTLEYACDQVKGDGLALEFGVGAGTTLEIIERKLGGGVKQIVGFDSFNGLPLDWKQGYPRGTFRMTDEEVQELQTKHELEIGMFHETLPKYLAAWNNTPIDFMHIDSDLFDSAYYVLKMTWMQWRPGTIIIFDEFLNYPGWQQGEAQAWLEFMGSGEEDPVEFEYIAYTYDHQQVVIRIL